MASVEAAAASTPLPAASAAAMDYYDGSRIFTWVSDLSGLSIDQVNFIISQFVALGLASLFRTVLHPSKASAASRHGFGLILGLIIGYFCFGMQAIHLAGLPAICYIVIRTQDPRVMQRMVLVVAFTYLSCIHLHRQIYDYGSYTLDITGPLMVITQKVTSLAYSIHDGLGRQDNEMTKNQKYYMVSKVPSPLEYFSYVLHFQALMAGPILFYVDYINFIDGTNLLVPKPTPSGNLDNNSNSRNVVIEPSPCIVVVKKVLSSLFCAVIFIKLIPMFHIQTIKDDEFVVNTGLAYKFWYLFVCTALVRFKYYHAWLFADAICNNSGLGFNGYNADGSARWDLISNIDIIKFEFSTSMRESIEAWNMGTNRWLRMIVYERVKTRGTILTYALSALWHGFYPGYYITFATGALFTLSARTMRRALRHYFTDSIQKKLFYDVLTGCLTRLAMAYTTFTFVLLELWPGIRLYLHMYLCLHIPALLALFIVPHVMPRAAKPALYHQHPLNNQSSTVVNNHHNKEPPTALATNGVCKNHHD